MNITRKVSSLYYYYLVLNEIYNLREIKLKKNTYNNNINLEIKEKKTGKNIQLQLQQWHTPSHHHHHFSTTTAQV